MAEEAKPEDFSYDTKTFAREVPAQELPPSFAPLYHSFAFESHKRSNLHYLDEDATLVFAAGGVVHFLDLTSMTSSYLPSLGGNEVGCIEVHQERSLLCVAEKGVMPNVFIYEYPSLSLIRVLKGGTEQAYSAAHFSGDGIKLATVGSYPDYMLTIWDWNKESIILRTKAFAQEVYRVRFSPKFDGQLVTSGTGHIRFWKMAQTFTGLKLQGDIGKFGQIELSDVEGFCEMPDGKILSGSDWGNLLLWEGNLIKCEIRSADGSNCHSGAVRSVVLHGASIITGGNDGYVRSWHVSEIEAAEPTDDAPIFGITSQKTVCLLDNEVGRNEAKVQMMLKGGDHWLVQDSSGGVYKVYLETGACKTIFSFHSGGINAIDLCPFNHAAATCGADGSVRLWDYVSKTCLSTFRSTAAATCLSWGARAVDPEGRTLCVGYSDGVVRIFLRCKDGLQLKTAFKPHRHALTAIAYSPDGNYISTAAEDGAVFFLSVSRGAYSPVGFVPYHANKASVTRLAWASDECLYVGYSDGAVAELNLPTDVDTSETYELPFHGVMYDAGAIVESRRMAIKAARAAEAAKVAPPPAAADETDSPLPIAETETPVEEQILDLETGAVSALLPLKAAPGESRSFYVAWANEPKTFWKGTWGSKEFASPSYRHDGGAIVSLRLARSGNMLLSGSSDGSVCVGEVGADAYWQGRVHGASASVQPMLSFDDAYLVSGGADGNLFVHKIATNDPKDAILAAIGLPDLKDSGLGGTDITDPATYSIEEAKQKEESDARAALANDKKLGVKQKVEALRKRFSNLLQENNALVSTDRLPRSAFYIDPGLKEETDKETVARLDEARAELAWTSEKSNLSRSKLEAHYMHGLAVESIGLYGFASGRCVRSFRTVELDNWQKEAMEHVHALIEKEAKSRARAGQRRSGEAGEAGTGEGDAEHDPLAGANDSFGGQNQKVSKMQERLLRRQQRSKEWAEFNSTKPDDKYEDPVDVAAIQYAETHMGDFSLKTDADYVVPEAQRVNAQKKRRQIVLLDESIHAIKMGFNERFLALRGLKKRILHSMAEEDERLKHIDKELSLQGTLDLELVSPGALVPAEEPELRSIVTQDQLEVFRVEQEAAAAKAKGGGMGGMASAPTSKPAAEASATTKAKPASSAGVSSKPSAAQTSLMVAEVKLQRERLLVEKERLIERRKSTIRSFDEALGELRAEKLRLEADLKTTDLRKLVLFQELALLKEFEKKDTSLAKRLESKINEKAEIVTRVAECQEKLSQKKVEIERLLDRDRQIMAEFSSAVGDGNKVYDQLLKIFKRKIKRKKVQDGGDEDEDEDEDEEDSEDDDDCSDEEEEEEACPAGCDPALYEKVCELRERRLDQEEVYTEFQKGVAALKTENEMLIKKEKGIDKALKDTEADIQSFQTEKQGKLNELHVVVTLQISQVRHIVEGKLPSDLTEDLVFPAKELSQLRGRIRQLNTEKSDLRKRQKVLRNEHVTLNREQNVKQGNLRELDARLTDVQMLKFGQVIDLERIESVGVNKGAEELTERIRSVERSQDEALTTWHEKLKSAKLDLKDATNESTHALNTVAGLFERQHALETSLNSKQAAVAPKEAGVERKERTSLVQLVKIQAKEVEALKLEINMLRRKGGHIYTGAK